MFRIYCFAVAMLISNLMTTPVQAGEAGVIAAKISKQSNGKFSISVTLKHADTGWDHYANAWEVLAPDGMVIATRILHHPHVEEQPFERSMGDIDIPKGIKKVIVRGKDSVHEYGGTVLELDVTR